MGRLAVYAVVGGSLFAATGARAQLTTPSVPPASGPSTPQAASTNPASSADTPPTAPAAAAPPTVGEIIVTAQRRSENLQNVPIAVTAVTAAKLASAGVSGTSDLSLVVPGLNLEASIGYAQPRLRGVGTTANGPGVENPVATYIDGVYIASAPASLLSFNNISQIEVLKGPQGTLFGRNATGGLIQITTPNPLMTPHGDVAVSYGAYDTSRIDGYVTGGLLAGVAADLAVLLGHQGDGYGSDRAIDRPVDRTDRDIALRSSVLIHPTGKTQIRVIADYENSESNDTFRPSPGTTPLFGANFGGSPWDTNEDFYPKQFYQGGGVSVNATQDLGFAQLLSISAYRRSNYFFSFDFDGTPAPISFFPDTFQQDAQISQELQLSSKASSLIQWAAGVYYFTSDARFNPSQTNFGPPVVSAASPLDQFNTFGDERTNSIAGYGQATAALTHSTHLTLGIRYTYEVRNFRGDEFADVADQIPIGALFPAVNEGVHYSRPTWRIALDQRFSPQVLAYVSYNRGFKSGGFNVSDPTNPAYEPETLDAYEIGVKTDLLNKRLRVNVAGFYYDYSNIQVARFTTGAIDFYNGAEADIYGLDLDIDAAISQDLRLSGGFELLHDRFNSFPNAEIGTPIPAGGTAETLGSAAGNRLPFSPDAVVDLSGDYTHDYGPVHVAANVTYAYNSGWFTEPDNRLRQKPFSTLNTSLSFSPYDGDVSLRLWAKNLTDAAVFTQDSTAGFFDTASYAPPRTFGFTVRKAF